MVTEDRAGRALSAAALALLAGWIAFDLLARPLLGSAAWTDSLVDYRLLYSHSRHVVTTGEYPPAYPYPPSAVVLHHATTAFDFPVSAGLWLALTGAAALGCWLTLAQLLRLNWAKGEYALLPLAHLSRAYFFQWDLRSANCNLLFLAALLLGVQALHRGKDGAAGFWLALAFSLKLFCVLVLAYLLFKGRRRALAWALAFVAVFWLALPALLFGIEGTWNVYGGWLDQMAWAAGHPADVHHPILTSLGKSGEWLAGGDGWLVVYGVRGLWLGLLLLGWLASARRREQGDSFGLLADVGLLTLAPIAVSPYLEPYHPVPFAIAALLLLREASDAGQGGRWRLLAALLFVASFVVLKLPLAWPAHGLLLNVKLLLAIGGAVLIAWRRSAAKPVQCLA